MELSAVVKIAAVNCEEDWILCRKEGISAYPTLVFYPNVSTMFSFEYLFCQSRTFSFAEGEILW